MAKYIVEMQMDKQEKFYFIRENESGDIVYLPSKYLMHKKRSKISPNTIQRSAFALSYYLNFLDEKQLCLDDIYQMKYIEQHEHFTDFLIWLKAGMHSREDYLKLPNNETCNAYLKEVFRFYTFMEQENKHSESLKVLSDTQMIVRNSIGIRKVLNRKSFRGYLKEKGHQGKTIEQDKIVVLLQECANSRDQVLLLLLAETGFRIGELLGVRYAEDIDYEKHIIYEVKRLLEYFKEEESICQVDENQLDDYFRKLEEKDTKDDTFNKRIVHYIKFYQFLNVRGYMKEIPFKPEYYLKKTYPEHHDRTVEEKVYMEILHKLYAFPLVPRLIFLHLWCTGLRISEVCTLKGDAYYWDGEDAWLKVYQIKMKADKMIPIPLMMYRIMRKYIEREHIRPKDYIFKGKDGGAYRGTTFRQEFQQYCDKNGIADGSYIFKTHDYRHTLATQFYDEDVSIQTIRDYLGHFSEEMTKQYVDFMPKRIEKASDTYFKKPENDLASTIKAKKRGERK